MQGCVFSEAGRSASASTAEFIAKIPQSTVSEIHENAPFGLKDRL